MNQIIKDIVVEYIRNFDEKSKLFPFIIQPSIPIVWFGDLDKYLNSKRKILTVGYSPSNKEFDGKRFDTRNYENADNLAKTLNEYFKKQPHLEYFCKFENVLRKLNASYWENAFSFSAIHINMYTAIATETEAQRKQIQRMDLFKKLLKTLSPDVIITSMKPSNLAEGFSFAFDTAAPNFSFTVTGKPNLFINMYKNENQILINGANSIRGPFAEISNKDLEETIEKIK